MRSYLEKTHHKKRAVGVTQGIGPEFKPQHPLQKKKKNRKSGVVAHTPEAEAVFMS
jgi:hypothetical protein